MPLPFRPDPGGVPELDHRAAAAAYAAGAATFVDVREADEWDEGHIPGAIHVPLSELPERVTELPVDRDLILVCHSGGRSYAATEFLVRHGFSRAANLDGGMLAWDAARLPVES
jgi:rhodanese-related sulfurtransferase